MSNRISVPLILLAATLAALAAGILISCEPEVLPVPEVPIQASSRVVFDGSTAGTFNFNIQGLAGESVYLVFTNSNTSTSILPTIRGADQQVIPGSWLGMEDLAIQSGTETGPAIKDMAAGNAEISKLLLERKGLQAETSASRVIARAVDVVDATTMEYDDDNNVDTAGVPVTLRLMKSGITTAQGSRTLRVWVADDCWEQGGTKVNLVTLNMVQLLADRFLSSGDANDVYDWVTNISGPEWGEHTQTDLISPTGIIDIVLFDIGANDTAYTGMMGYFWNKDNIPKSIVPASNEIIAFALDAPCLACPLDDGLVTDSNGWNLDTDFFPRQVVSTLSHEFEHMIDFYQTRGTYPMSNSAYFWINEAKSMAMEEMIADKLQCDGPRGVAYDDYTAGSSGNYNGRLPLFNLFNTDSLTAWYTNAASQQTTLQAYAKAYSFGAFVFRNYGGPELMPALNRSTAYNYQAFVDGVNAINTSETLSFTDLLRRWGASILYSDRQSAPAGVKSNEFGGFAFVRNGISYNMGSINYFNYRISYTTLPDNTIHTLDGPMIGSSGNIPTVSSLNPQSNAFYCVGTGLSGNSSLQLTLPAGVYVTVVVK